MQICMRETCGMLWHGKQNLKINKNLYLKLFFYNYSALGIPTSEFSFEDVIVMNRAKDLKIPFPGDIVIIERTLDALE